MHLKKTIKPSAWVVFCWVGGHWCFLHVNLYVNTQVCSDFVCIILLVNIQVCSDFVCKILLVHVFLCQLFISVDFVNSKLYHFFSVYSSNLNDYDYLFVASSKNTCTAKYSLNVKLIFDLNYMTAKIQPKELSSGNIAFRRWKPSSNLERHDVAI